MNMVFSKLNNAEHCTYGQLFVLHCAADHHLGKNSPLLLNFLQTANQQKFQSKNKG